MPTDWLYLSPTPLEEDCAQVGEVDFHQRATKEMTAFIGQLYRKFPDAMENGVYFRIKWENHEFGTYGEVVAAYDSDDETACEYALNVEHNIPEYWDQESISEMKGE